MPTTNTLTIHTSALLDLLESMAVKKHYQEEDAEINQNNYHLYYSSLGHIKTDARIVRHVCYMLEEYDLINRLNEFLNENYYNHPEAKAVADETLYWSENDPYRNLKAREVARKALLNIVAQLRQKILMSV